MFGSVKKFFGFGHKEALLLESEQRASEEAARRHELETKLVKSVARKGPPPAEIPARFRKGVETPFGRLLSRHDLWLLHNVQGMRMDAIRKIYGPAAYKAALG